METISIDFLTQKLKKAPQNILERVNGYIDALLEHKSSSNTYSLSLEQQRLLDSQLNADKSTYIDAETVYKDLKNKYEL
jgi:hypothetical protein